MYVNVLNNGGTWRYLRASSVSRLWFFEDFNSFVEWIPGFTPPSVWTEIFLKLAECTAESADFTVNSSYQRRTVWCLWIIQSNTDITRERHKVFNGHDLARPLKGKLFSYYYHILEINDHTLGSWNGLRLLISGFLCVLLLAPFGNTSFLFVCRNAGRQIRFP